MNDFYAPLQTRELDVLFEPLAKNANLFEPLVKSVNLRLVTSMRPAMENWRAVCAEMAEARIGPLVQTVGLGLTAKMQPLMESLNAVVAASIVAPLKPIEELGPAIAAQLRLYDWEAVAAAARAAAAAQAGAAGVGDVTRPPMTISATGKVTGPDSSKSTLPERMAGLTCGQALMILIICGAVLLYVDLPSETRARIEGLITVLGAAIWLAGKISSSQ